MINDAQVFLSGYVAREPRFRITASGISNVSMRVAYTPRRVDRDTGEWTDGATSFVSVVCWRTLADNVAKCLHKGEPVVVKGRLQVRPYEKDGVSRLAVEVEAASVGHDLAHGVASFQRPRRPAVAQAAPDGAGAEPGSAGGPVAEAVLDGGGEALAALAGRSETVPALGTPDGSGEPGGTVRPVLRPRLAGSAELPVRQAPWPYAVTQRHSSAASRIRNVTEMPEGPACGSDGQVACRQSSARCTVSTAAGQGAVPKRHGRSIGYPGGCGCART